MAEGIRVNPVWAVWKVPPATERTWMPQISSEDKPWRWLMEVNEGKRREDEAFSSCRGAVNQSIEHKPGVF